MTYMPLAELPVRLEEGGGFAWQVAANHFIDQQAVTVNVNRAVKIARMAGFSGLVVRQHTDEPGETRNNVTAITGCNSDGTAIGAASATTQRTSLYNTSTEGNNRTVPPNYNWPVAVVSLERNGLARRAADAVAGGQDRSAAWAEAHDFALRRGLVRASWTKLKQDILFSPQSSIASACYTSPIPILTAAEPLVGFGGFLAAHAAILIGDTIINQQFSRRSYIERKRWSLFAGPIQPDRLALAALAAESFRLIRHKA